MKTLKTILGAVMLISTLAVNAQTWSNDPAHSQLYFTVTHLGISDISGTFDDFTTSVTATKEDFSDAVFTMSAKIASVNTLVEARNNHLKSADFFDAEKFPEMTFKSTAIKSAGKNKYKLTGDLSIHGVTKTVTMDLEYKGQTTNPMSSKLTSAFLLTGTLKRSDFAVGEKFPEAMVSDLVRIKASGEFVQAEE